MAVILANIKFRHVNYDKADAMGLDSFEEESFVIGDLFINDIRTYFESETKGFLIVSMFNNANYEIEMSLDKFRAFLKICGYTIIEEVSEKPVVNNSKKQEWIFAKEFITASSE